MNPRSNDNELTRHTIDTWYHRVSTGQAEVSRLEGEIELLKKQQRDIQTNLLPAKIAAIASVEEHIARLEVSLKTIKTQEQVGGALQLSELEIKPMNKQDLESHLSGKLDELNQLRLEKEKLEASLSQSKGNIDSVKQLLAKADDEVRNLLDDEYLDNLWNHPTILINSLIDDIRTQLAAYEDAHPANQIHHVQMSLVEIERGVNYIENIEANDVPGRRKKYYELVGLLQCVQERNAATYSQGLSLLVGTILAKHRIPANEAKEAYEDLCSANPVALPVLTAPLVNQYLSRKYAEAREQLRRSCTECYRRGTPEWNALYKKGVVVLAEIEDEKLRCYQKKDNSFDTKFYTKLLRKTAQVMREPQNDSLRKEYQALANHNQSGKASLSRKLAGAMLALIGAAMVVAAVVADVASLGISSAVSWTAKIGGCVTGLMGFGLFASGLQHGISLATDRFNSAAKNVKDPGVSRDRRPRNSEVNERALLLRHR